MDLELEGARLKTTLYTITGSGTLTSLSSSILVGPRPDAFFGQPE